MAAPRLGGNPAALFPALFLGLQCTPSLNRRLPCVRMSANDIDGAVQVSKLPTAAQLCSAADEEVAGLTDLVWTAICGQAAAASSSPVLAPFFQTTISSQSTLPKALARVLARKIALDGLTLCYPLADELACIFGEPAVCKLITSDLLAVKAQHQLYPARNLSRRRARLQPAIPLAELAPIDLVPSSRRRPRRRRHWLPSRRMVRRVLPRGDEEEA